MRHFRIPISILAASISRILSSLIFATCRFEIFGDETTGSFRPSHPRDKVLYATWHQRLIPYIWYYRFKKVVVMASMSRDGELASRYVRAFGWIPVRGSSRRRGREALNEMVPYVEKGHSAALACDAPTGPAYVSKMGIVSLAQKTGRPIQAGVWGCDRYWTLRSWDRTRVPKPFSRILLMFADPIYVAKNASHDTCEGVRKLLEERLNTMMNAVDHCIALGCRDPEKIDGPIPLRQTVPAKHP